MMFHDRAADAHVEEHQKICRAFSSPSTEPTPMPESTRARADAGDRRGEVRGVDGDGLAAQPAGSAAQAPGVGHRGALRGKAAEVLAISGFCPLHADIGARTLAARLGT